MAREEKSCVRGQPTHLFRDLETIHLRQVAERRMVLDRQNPQRRSDLTGTPQGRPRSKFSSVGEGASLARADAANSQVREKTPFQHAKLTFNPSGVIADATNTPTGGQVGVIVWGRSDANTGLEIYPRRRR